jgi:hypothetical protein
MKERRRGMTDKRLKSFLEDRLRRLESIKNEREFTTAELGDITCCKQTLEFIDSLQEESVSEDLEKELSRLLKDCEIDSEYIHQDFLHIVANHFSDWQKERMMKNIWKPADGDDLPEIDREVIALLDNGKVVFAHRPPEYWDGKNIITGKVTRNYPKTYDKGGWNIPNVKWWLDVYKLPNVEE